MINILNIILLKHPLPTTTTTPYNCHLSQSADFRDENVLTANRTNNNNTGHNKSQPKH